MGGNNLETRSLIDELRPFDKTGGLFDLGHPLLNRVAESFVKAAGVCNYFSKNLRDEKIVKIFFRLELFRLFLEKLISLPLKWYVGGAGVSGDNGGMPPGIGGSRRNRFPDLKGETNKKSVEALVKGSGKESLQWGLAAGMYSGLTYGLKEARGVHDWKNSAMAGAVTGAALALTSDDSSHEQIVQCAITGAAISTAANLLTGIF